MSPRPLISAVLLTCVISLHEAVVEEICNAESFSASCGINEVILMEHADYGRREMGRCITKEEPHMGCGTEVRSLLDRWCSGRQKCDFLVPNPDLVAGNKQSPTYCPDYLNLYLKAGNHCVSVESGCSNKANDLDTEEGFLSSHVTDQTGCGSSRSPWKLSVSQGKTINITLFDFAGESSDNNYMACRYTYGFVMEKALGINYTICGRQARERALYISKTNKVEIHFLTSTVQRVAHYLIKYAAIGCAELIPPPNAWYKREGNKAVIGCETNDQEWRLTCTGNTWQGTVGNCSTPAVAEDIPDQTETPSLKFTSVIVMTSMICAVFVAVVIAVMCGVIYLKKYRLRQETKRMQTTYATMEKHSYHPPTNVNTLVPNSARTDAPSERLVDVPGTWVQTNTFGRHGTMTSYPDQCMCPTLPGARS